MAKNYFDRYIWLIDLVNRHGHISFEEIDRAWSYNSRLNKEGGRLPERTFFNHIKAIEDIFGIEIKCDRSLGYYIANTEDLEGDGIRQRMIETIAMSNMLKETKEMRSRILVENVPSSQRWLTVILEAMRDNKAVELSYQGFGKPEASTFSTYPYCVKLFRQRWYMVATSEGHEEPRIYALDRFVDVRVSNEKYTVPKRFDAEKFFGDHFGIIVKEDIPVMDIEIKVFESQVAYLRTLPIHHSQRETSQGKGYSIFRFHLAPTYDFIQELLSHGDEVEVLGPEILRDEVAGIAERMNAIYKR